MPRITELYAYVVADKDEDDEGVPAFVNADLMWVPMMGADMDRARGLRAEAVTVARTTGKTVKLIRSTGIEVVEVIEP